MVVVQGVAAAFDNARGVQLNGQRVGVGRSKAVERVGAVVRG